MVPWKKRRSFYYYLVYTGLQDTVALYSVLCHVSKFSTHCLCVSGIIAFTHLKDVAPAKLSDVSTHITSFQLMSRLFVA